MWIAVIYKWYAWYLLAYNREKEDYRTYKLVRMESVYATQESFSKEHKQAEEIMNHTDDSYQRKEISTRIRMKCHGNAIHRIKEYLNGKIIEIQKDGTAIMEIQIVETEQWWIGV